MLDEPFLDELERRANDPARLDEEAQRASEQTQQAEARNEVGVHVYALPHYIRCTRTTRPRARPAIAV